MLYPASTSSTVRRSPTPKNLVGLPPPVPQGDARQDAQAQEQSGGGRQDHTRTAEPRTTGLGIGCVLSILDGCGAFIMMVPSTPGWAAAFCSTCCTAGSITSGGPLASISASHPTGVSASSEISSSCAKATGARRSIATRESTAQAINLLISLPIIVHEHSSRLRRLLNPSTPLSYFIEDEST